MRQREIIYNIEISASEAKTIAEYLSVCYEDIRAEKLKIIAEDDPDAEHELRCIHLQLESLRSILQSFCTATDQNYKTF